MKKLILFLSVIAALASCRTPANITPERDLKDSTVIKYETKYNLIIKDSVRINDSTVIHPDGSVSTFHTEKQSSSKKETLYIYSYINRHIEKKLTITKTIEIEKKRSWFEIAFIWIGKITSVLLLITALYFGMKFYLQLKSKIIV